MATSVNSQQLYLQVGPRQGVFIRPDRVTTHPEAPTDWNKEQTVQPSSLKWGRLQFRNPAELYKYRARVEPAPTPTYCNATIVAQRLDYRPHSSRPAMLRRSSSSNSLPVTSPRSSLTVTAAQPGKHYSKNPSIGMSVNAHAVVMQPRATPGRSPSKSKTIIVEEPFSYPCPTKIRGNPAFDVRLAELTHLQADTVRYEEAIHRMNCAIRKTRLQRTARPSSAKEPHRPGIKSITPVHRQSLPVAIHREQKLSPRPSSAQYSYANSHNHRRSQSVKSPGSSSDIKFLADQQVGDLRSRGSDNAGGEVSGAPLGQHVTENNTAPFTDSVSKSYTEEYKKDKGSISTVTSNTARTADIGKSLNLNAQTGRAHSVQDESESTSSLSNDQPFREIRNSSSENTRSITAEHMARSNQPRGKVKWKNSSSRVDQASSTSSLASQTSTGRARRQQKRIGAARKQKGDSPH